jgi:hypothetical protein
MDTERRFPGDLDPVVRVRTLDSRRVARLPAETLWSLIGLIVRGIAGSFGHLLASPGWISMRTPAPASAGPAVRCLSHAHRTSWAYIKAHVLKLTVIR